MTSNRLRRIVTGATHAPLHVPKAWIDHYRGQFDQGWDRLREETFARQKKLGVMPAGAEGVLAAHGGRFGGYSLYVKNGRLVYEINVLGRNRQVLTSSEPIPSGPVELAFEFTPDSRRTRLGTGRLLINGKPVGEVHLSGIWFTAGSTDRNLRHQRGARFDGLDRVCVAAQLHREAGPRDGGFALGS
ncbi:MAG: sulfatase [Proteobacteria bacterium]|nr:sulfatase [Pseudomonadota bacterium]